MAKKTTPTAFTLVEILIVVIILGILAAIVIPQFSSASQNARISMLADNLRIMRTQVMVFTGQHNAVAPGYPGGVQTQTPTETDFVAHLTQASTQTFGIAAPGTSGYPYGPYMSRMPENPINGKASILIVADGQPFPTTPTDGYGWVYQANTLLFKSDAAGTDETGRRFFDY
jgi:general secretion pathway protein G